MPLKVIELLLEIVLEGMRGQTPEQKKLMWDWYIQDMAWWRKHLQIDAQEKA